MTDSAARPVHSARRDGAGRAAGLLLLIALTILLVGAGLVHLTQGTADVGPSDVWAHLLGRGSEFTSDVVIASRAPRLFAGVLVGACLGAAGATMQGLARNPLASPDTLAVNAGAHLALTLVAALGLSTGDLGGIGVAFLGGLAAAGVALGIASGGRDPVRLVLGGSVLALALASVTSALLLVFSQETQGLFAWGAGSLQQAGPGTVQRVAVPVALLLVVLVVLGGRLDLLQLGDDAARSLGVHVAATRTALVVLAVGLSTCAVTVAGPIGFVGLCAPAFARLFSRRVRVLLHHRWLLVASALLGALVVICSDVALRAVIGARDAVEIPTGVMTTLVGGVVLVVLSRDLRPGCGEASAAPLASRRGWAARHPAVVIAALLVLTVVCATLALLFGDGMLLLGDVWNWLTGVSGRRITWTLDARAPRVAASLLAGACFALAGLLTQSVTRNPLADPGLLGVAGGAGVGALSAILAGALGGAGVAGGALVGALAAAAVVFGLSARGGWQPTRLVLVGLGVQAVTAATTTLLVVSSDPWNQSRALTWLGGSTYGVTFDRLWPVAVVLLVALLALTVLHRQLDLVALDELTPRLLGVGVGSTRIVALLLAVALTAAATSGVGVIGFVGLVAPHGARMLVGSRHARLAPASMLVGALVVLIADTVGRTVLAPSQLPVGLVCSLVGVGWFCWLLWYSRRTT